MEGNSTLQNHRDMFYEQKKIINEQLQELQTISNLLLYKCFLYDMAVDAGISEVYKNMKPEYFPDEIRQLKEQLPFTT